LGNVELGLGALSESFYSKYALEDIERDAGSRGEKVVSWERRFVVNGREVDLVVETEKAVYVVEVKVKPTTGDVRALLRTAKLIARLRPDKEIRPVLAGALIGLEIKRYAETRRVKVLSY